MQFVPDPKLRRVSDPNIGSVSVTHRLCVSRWEKFHGVKYVSTQTDAHGRLQERIAL